MLSVEKIDCFYGQLHALKGVSIVVEENEIVAVLGANGAGKSTLFRAITGLLPPRSGQIKFAGKRIDNLQPHGIVRLGVAHVPEGRMLFAPLTVLENLKLGAYPYYSKDCHRFAANLDRVLTLFPILKEKLNQCAGNLSGGQQQMLAIGRAMMAEPKLLLLDEPSLGLAPVVVDEIFDSLRRLKTGGLSILIAEQNIANALELADRAYILQVGSVALEGQASELLGRDDLHQLYLGGQAPERKASSSATLMMGD